MKKYSLLLTSFFFLLATKLTLAQDAIGTLEPPSSTIVTRPEDLGPKLFTNVVYFLTALAGIWTFLQLILGGLGYITGGGDQKKVAESQQKIVNSLIGIVIVASSFIIANLAGSLLFGPGFSILSPTFKGL